MADTEVISKGRYDFPQTENAIPVDSYIFVRDGGKKYLLLKFNNPRKGVLTGVDLQITMLTPKGRELGVKDVSFHGIYGKPKKDCVLTRRIEVDGDCSECRVKVVSAHYGAYSYLVDKGSERVDYVTEKNEKFDVGKAIDELGWERAAVSERTVKNRVLIAIISCVLFFAVLAFTILQLAVFKKTEETFSYSGVEYAFVNGDRSSESDVYAAGLLGVKHNVTIPEEIEGHRVVKISEGAFSGNSRLRSLTVEGEIVIEKNAFSNCKNLETVTANKVTAIGKEAFSNCVKLNSFTAGNLNEIEDGAFKNCSALSNVSITNERKKLTLGKNVFEKCGGLQTVDISQTIIYPSDMTLFRDCYKLSSLTLKNFSTEGGARTLVSLFGTGTRVGQMLSLQTVKIGTLDRISENFLSYCSSLQSVTVSSLTSPVISNYAFYNCASLTELKLPLSPTEVGYRAFSGSGLTSFDFKEVTSIRDYAFSESALDAFDAPNLNFLGANAFEFSALTSVTIPQNLWGVSEYAFRGCSSLTSLTVHDAVREIGKGAFAACNKLESLTVPFVGGSLNANTHLGYVFGASDYTESERLIPQSLRSVTVTGGTSVPDFAFVGATSVQRVKLPDNTAVIGESAFSGCSSLSTINFPETLTSIGKYAFGNCGSLTSVTLPDSVTTIGAYAFSGCNRVSELTVPFAGDDYISNLFKSAPSSLGTVTVTKADTIGDYAFSGCTGLQKVNLPENLKKIGAYAFSNCGLTEIAIPETVTVIDVYAFKDCVQLKQFTIPSSVTFIGERTTFEGCLTLWEIRNYSNCPVWAVNARVYTQTDLQLQKFAVGGYEFGYSAVDEKTEYRYRLLNYPRNTKSLQLPYGFTCSFNGEVVEGYSIPSYLFYKDSTITAVKLPACIVRLGEYAFAECTNLETVEFDGAEFTKIEANTFDNCSKLKSIIIPKGVTEIANNAFYACTSLETVTFSPQINTIGGSAFQYCVSLEEVFLPDELTLINIYAFYGCTALRSVTLPKYLSSVGSYAFGGCERLKLIFNYSEIELTKNTGSYGEVALNALYIVTSQTEDAGYFQNGGVYYLHCFGEWTAVWCADGVKEITLDGFVYNGQTVNSLSVLAGAFAGESSIKKVIIGSAVKVLGENAFSSCVNLETLEISAGLTQISGAAFADCQSLTSVKIPSSVYAIGESAFAYCNNIETVELSENLEIIGAYAFAYCNRLPQIIIPASVTGIGNNAFIDCNRLYVVYNLSALSITERSTANGRVAENAQAVFTSLADKAEFQTVGEFEFIYLSTTKQWYLYKYTGGSNNVILPQRVSANNAEYTVKNYAFSTNFYSVLIPKSVVKIDDFAFGKNYYFTVYFEGTEEEWIKLRPANISGATCFHYVECVHYDREWTYLNGKVSTQWGYYGYEWTVTKEPTCAETGEQLGVCPHCKQYTTTSTIPKTDKHEYEWAVTTPPTCTEYGIETGTCKVCGQQTVRAADKRGHDLDENGKCKNCGYEERNGHDSEKRS